MIRTKGEAGTGNVVEAVTHMRTMLREMAELTTLRPEQYVAKAKELGAPVDLVREIASTGRLPVVNFAAGGIATPADAALMMQLGVDGVFVGSGIYKSQDPPTMARAMRLAVEAGRAAYLAGRMPRREVAVPSSPLRGMLE